MNRPVAFRIVLVAAVLLIVTTSCQLFSPTPAPEVTPPPADTPQVSTVAAQTVQPATPPVSPTAPAGAYSAANCELDGTLKPSQSGLGDPYFPDLGNGGYDVLVYKLVLDVDMASKKLDASETITAQAQQELKSFNLEFSDFQIDSLLVNTQKAEYQRKGNEMTVTPASPLPAGESFTVTIEYNGSPRAMKPVNESITLGWIWYEGGAYVASEPEGSFTWYAVNDHPCDKALYTYVVTVPKPYVVAANGLLESRTEQGNQVTYTWATQNPLTSYLSTVNIARFKEETQQGPNGLPIRNFYDAGLPSGVEKGFNRTPQIVDFYNQTFGTYPFEAYGVAVINSDIGFALETQTLTMFGARMLGSQVNTEMVAAHELAHQWFGDSVSLTTWKDIWLNESFASYSQWLWLEKSLGRSALDSQARQWYSNFRGDPTKPGDPGVNDLFSAAVYYRGALALHALRLNLGDETFFKIMKTYYERNQYQHVTTADFISVANEVSGQDLTDFFQGWLYEERIPDIPQMNLHSS